MTDDTSAELKNRFAISPLIDPEINVGALGWAGLTPDADHDVRMSVTAAVIAEFMGYKSIDRVRKKIADNSQPHKARDHGVRQLCRTHLACYESFYRSFTPRSNARMGIFAFDLAMVRSRSSIELMLITARQGFLIEPCLTARSLVEQFAYALKVWPAADEETIFQTKAQSVITSLKSVNPASGRAYGMLSALAHYDPKMHYSFIGSADSISDNGSSLVNQRSWLFKISSLAWVFFILDLKFRIFKSCYGDYDNFQILKKLDNTVIQVFDDFFSEVNLQSVQSIRALIAAQ